MQHKPTLSPDQRLVLRDQPAMTSCIKRQKRHWISSSSGGNFLPLRKEAFSSKFHTHGFRHFQQIPQAAAAAASSSSLRLIVSLSLLAKNKEVYVSVNKKKTNKLYCVCSRRRRWGTANDEDTSL
jgi:hypothetical protein